MTACGEGYRLASAKSSTITGHAITGFTLFAFLITLLSLSTRLSCAVALLNSITRSGCLDYRLASAKSSTITGHAITGFTLVAFLITVIFIVISYSWAGRVMRQRNDRVWRGLPLGQREVVDDNRARHHGFHVVRLLDNFTLLVNTIILRCRLVELENALGLRGLPLGQREVVDDNRARHHGFHAGRLLDNSDL